MTVWAVFVTEDFQRPRLLGLYATEAAAKKAASVETYGTEAVVVDELDVIEDEGGPDR